MHTSNFQSFRNQGTVWYLMKTFICLEATRLVVEVIVSRLATKLMAPSLHSSELTRRLVKREKTFKQKCFMLDIIITKMLEKYMLPRVCVRLRQFSQRSSIKYMVLYVFSLPNSLVMMLTLSYYHHQIEVWISNHCLGLGHETMVRTVCLTMFLWKGLHVTTALPI